MKILIVEDEKELAQDIAQYLSGEEHLCEWAANYQQAVEKIELYVYDCVLLDIMIRDGGGLGVSKKIKSRQI